MGNKGGKAAYGEEGPDGSDELDKKRKKSKKATQNKDRGGNDNDDDGGSGNSGDGGKESGDSKGIFSFFRKAEAVEDPELLRLRRLDEKKTKKPQVSVVERSKIAKRAGITAMAILLMDDAIVNDPANLTTVLVHVIVMLVALQTEAPSQRAGKKEPPGSRELVTSLVKIMTNYHPIQNPKANSEKGEQKRSKEEEKAITKIAYIEKQCCEACSYISKIQSIKESMFSRGGLECLVQTLRLYPQDESIQWWGANALFFLCRDGPTLQDDNMLKLRDAGVQEMYEGVLVHYPVIQDATRDNSANMLRPHVEVVLRMLRSLNNKVLSEGHERVNGRVVFVGHAQGSRMNLKGAYTGRESTPSFGGNDLT